MSGPPRESLPAEEEVVNVIETLTKAMRERRFEDLWIPTEMIHDAESDDQLAMLLLKYVHNRRRERLQATGSAAPPALRVLVQLPTPKTDYPELEELDQRFKVNGCETFRDPSSQNAKGIKHTLNRT